MSKKTSIGGQALLEGIMMVGPKKIVAAFCDEENNITKEEIEINFIRDKYPILKKPFIRGIFSYVDTMRLGMKAMQKSADKITVEEEIESKFDKWLNKTFGDKMSNVIIGVASVLGIALSVFLFIFLPTLSFSGIEMLFGESVSPFRSIFEGVMRLVIFIVYLLLVSMIPDIKRVFQYHGAEHKTIFCYEKGLPLTVENIKKQSRFHPRCGTSFLIILILLGIIVGFFIPFTDPIIRTASKIITLPIVVSVGYELIKFCGKFDNLLVRIISAPGIWVQRITTKEPDENMIKTAIVAMEEVIPENGEDLI